MPDSPVLWNDYGYDIGSRPHRVKRQQPLPERTNPLCPHCGKKMKHAGSLADHVKAKHESAALASARAEEKQSK